VVQGAQRVQVPGDIGVAVAGRFGAQRQAMLGQQPPGAGLITRR
jgi:hypothetical protein